GVAVCQWNVQFPRCRRPAGVPPSMTTTYCSMSALLGSGGVGATTVRRGERAPHLLAPSTGIYAGSRQPEALRHCDDCGSPIRNTGAWNRPRYVCGNYECPKCPFQRERVNSSFSVVEG